MTNHTNTTDAGDAANHVAFTLPAKTCPECGGRGCTPVSVDSDERGPFIVEDICHECDGYGEVPAEPVGDWVTAVDREMKETDSHVT